MTKAPWSWPRRGLRLGLCALVVAGAALQLGAQASAERAGDVDFLGGWELGGTRPWTFMQWGGATDGTPPLASQFTLVQSPVRAGSFAARFSVSPGDRYGGSTGERSEATWRTSGEAEGQTYYYAWSTLFDADWVTPGGWAITLQWHSDARFPLSPLRFNVTGGDRMRLDMSTGDCSDPYRCSYRRNHLVLRTLSKGQWNDFVLRVRWSTENGSVELWHRVAGRSRLSRVLRLPHVPTLPWRPNDPVPADIYISEGIYRRDDPARTAVVYQDCFRRATSFAAAAAVWGSRRPLEAGG